MSWAKLSSEINALCVDLLKNVDGSNLCDTRSKSDKLSSQFRHDGNLKILKNEYHGAIKLYNKSIRFAVDNETLSLAYANRSYCYMKLNLFDQCLVDIEHANEACYPEHLAIKLEKRKKECIEKKKFQIKSSCAEPRLSYEADNKLPCIANVLKIESNKQFGRLITAKCDINVGDTLLVETAYIRSSTGDECHNCAKAKFNLIPCISCVDAMYCSKFCAENNFHHVECKMSFDSDNLNFILRSIITGINTFTTIDEMIEFVNCIQSTDPNEICYLIDTPKTKYSAFFKLCAFITEQRTINFRQQAASIYRAIMNSTIYGSKFETQEKQRFLLHLIYHHASVIFTNAFGGLCEPPDELIGSISERIEHSDDYERSIFLVSSYFNHSCLPNVTKLSKDNLAVVKAILPIQSGQQLFIKYLVEDPVEQESIVRNDELESGYGFRCKCELCVSGVQKNALILEMDLDFQYVVCNINHYQVLLNQIKERCIKFVSNYQKNIASEPGYFILRTLTAMLQKELDRQ